MERLCLGDASLLRGVTDFLVDLRSARSSPDDVLAELESRIRTGDIQPGLEPVQPAVNERSRVQVENLFANYNELLKALGGSIFCLSPEIDFVAATPTPKGLASFHVEARPEIPVFRFSNPDQTRRLVREAILRDEQLFSQVASALTALAAQLVDDLTGRVPIDPSSAEVQELAASAEELGSSFYLFHNQRFGMFFSSLGLAHRADAVEPFLRCLAHVWDLGYEPEMDSSRILRVTAILEDGLQAFRDWASQRPEARRELTELYRRALWYGPQRLLASYTESVERRARAGFGL